MRKIAKDLVRLDECNEILSSQDSIILNYGLLVESLNTEIITYKDLDTYNTSRINGLETELSQRDYTISELEKTAKHKNTSNKILLSSTVAGIVLSTALILIR